MTGFLKLRRRSPEVWLGLKATLTFSAGFGSVNLNLEVAERVLQKTFLRIGPTQRTAGL